MQALSTQQKQLFQEIGFSSLPISTVVLLECLEAINGNKSLFELFAAIKKDPVLYLRSLDLMSNERPLLPSDLENTQLHSNITLQSAIHRLIKSTAVTAYFNNEAHSDTLASPSTLSKVANLSNLSNFPNDESGGRYENNADSLYDRYWKEARQCGLVAEALAKATNYPHPQEAYLAGLLHNLGQLIRLIQDKDDYVEIYTNSASCIDLELFEKEWFGSTSAQIASFLSEPLLEDSFLSEAILFQFETPNTLLNAPQLVRIVALASNWVQPNTDHSALFANIEQLLQISREHSAKIENSIQQQQVIDHGGIDLVVNNDTQIHRKRNDQLKQLCYQLAFENSLNPTLGHDEKSLWSALIDNFQILFGQRPLMLFKLSGDTLQVQTISHDTPAKVLQIRFDRASIHGSSLASALKDREPVFYHQQTGGLNIVDQQLCRYLNRENLLSIPLLSNGLPTAVLVAGLVKTNNSEVIDSERLDVYSRNANKILEQIGHTAERSTQRIEQYKESHSEAIRKLVHESANPLGVINNYIEVLKQSLSMDVKTASQLETIRKEINRVSRLLHKIRDVETSPANVTQHIDLNRIIRSQVDLLNASLFRTHDIRCDLELEMGIKEISIASESVKQILLNLLKNSVEAIGNSGRILIRTRSGINFNGSVYTELLIIDNGPGIDSAIISAAFSPVPTTKGNSHSGLGLAIVSQLVQEMGGLISCQNSTEGGAEFRILFPCEC